MDSITKFNPRINKLEIGTREIREIKIYPFSAGQEIEVVEIVSTMINVMAEQQRENGIADFQIFEMFSSVIKEKLEKIVEFVTDPEDRVTLSDFDNVQLAEFIEVIFEANFGDSVKKFQEIWEKAKVLFPSPKSPPKSLGKRVTN